MQPQQPVSAPTPQTNPMPPTMQPQQPFMPQPPQTLNYFYSEKCWYIPDGKWSTWSAQEGLVTVYPGLMTLTDKLTGQEARRWPLNQSFKMEQFFAQCRIRESEGKKFSMFGGKGQVYFYNPLYLILTSWVMFFGSSKAKALKAAAVQGGAANK